MNLELAAERTIEAAQTVGDSVKTSVFCGRDSEGRMASHAIWMLEGIKEGYIQHEKAHRWLGYAQGLLVAHGCLTLDEAKDINKRA